MNSEQAKKLSLPAILSQLGYDPMKTLKAGTELWYKSPFRNENTPSFHASYLGGKWIWNDFGDSGGNVLDFAMRYKNTDVKGALEYLRNLIGQPSLFYAPPAVFNAQVAHLPPDLEVLSIVKIEPLSLDSFNGKALLQYLSQKRAIDPVIACKHLVEVQYRNNENGKVYFAVGIRNEKGGYEIRNPYFKSSIGEKGISFIKGKIENQVSVFEGFIDFLSALTYFQIHDLSMLEKLYYADAIIMNSASFQGRIMEYLKQSKYKKIFLFTDNDETGRKAKEEIVTEFTGKMEIEDWSKIYEPYKDFNLFIQSKK